MVKMTPVVMSLQPVILAGGKGSRMEQLLGSSVIKCLVPIRGFPLIYFPLKFLAQNGFAGTSTRVLIIVQEKEKEEIRFVVEKYNEKLGLNVDIFAIPEEFSDEEEELDFGTCQSLQAALTAQKILKDILLLSCDTITNVNFSEVLQLHNVYHSDITTVFLGNLNTTISPTTKLHGPKNKAKPEKDIIGTDALTSSLVFMASEADCEEHLIGVPFTTITKCPHIKLRTNLSDSHIYIIKKKVLEMQGIDGESLLKKHISIKGEFIPFLLNSKYLEDTTPELANLSVFAYTDSSKQCIRVNTIPSYSIINKLNDWLHKTFDIGIIPQRDNESTTQIGTGAKLVGGSLVGEQCVVGEKAKLTNTILMDDVQIGENCTVDNCIVAPGCRIGAKSVVKECLIGPKYVIPNNSQFTNEYLTVMEETYFET